MCVWVGGRGVGRCVCGWGGGGWADVCVWVGGEGGAHSPLSSVELNQSFKTWSSGGVFCRAPDVTGSTLGLVGLVSVSSDLVR